MNFRHTRRALAEYERTRPERKRLFDWAGANQDHWVQAEEVALNAVREAFFLDTSHVNHWHHAMSADLAYMKWCVYQDDKATKQREGYQWPT